MVNLEEVKLEQTRPSYNFVADSSEDFAVSETERF